MNLYQFTVDRTVASAKLNVYLTGTTTATTFYTDPAGTTAGSSPLTADGAGQFAPIYLDPSITYRIKVTNSAGSTTYYDIDPVRVTDEGTADGVLTVRSVDDGKKRIVPANVSAIYTAGYANKGDRGQALYARVASAPSHAAKFQSADGAWWELSENLLNPFMFGAKGDDTTNDSPAIQAMFDFMVTKAKPYPFNFMGAKYYVHDRITLPTIPLFVSIDINGGGATLRTDQLITIFERLATDSTDAAQKIAGCHYDIHHFVFQGTAPASQKTQIGVHIGAAYTNVVRNCWFYSLNYGTIGTFCLAGAWRDNLYHNCNQRAAVAQSATGYDNGAVWSDTDSSSPSNVSVFENCRVYGHPDQISAFGIFASDSVRMNGCISEGAGAHYDVHFDYKGSTTVKNFHVDTFHCEANSKLNFKVRAAGMVCIRGLVREGPAAAIYDGQGSNNCEVFFRDISWFGLTPVGGATPSDPANPNGRWFFHGDGNGYGAATEGGTGSAVYWHFENCVGNLYATLGSTAIWENGIVPLLINAHGLTVGGVAEWSPNGTTFKTRVILPDGNNIDGMLNGNVSATTTSVPANSTVIENFTITGLLYAKHFIYANPYAGYEPPAGIVWNAYIYTNGVMRIRFTNVTGSAISMTSGAQWSYCALKKF